MNSSEHEPLPTSIQAGEPVPVRASVDEDDSIDVRVPSALDRLVEPLKAHERWGLVAGIGVQMLVLGGMIVMGTWKALSGAVGR